MTTDADKLRELAEFIENGQWGERPMPDPVILRRIADRFDEFKKLADEVANWPKGDEE